MSSKVIRILIYQGKHGDEYWIADTDAQVDCACRKLFKRFDEDGCYEDDEPALKEAREGDIQAIRHLLTKHRGFEYEKWSIVIAVDPLCE
jgi:hypothetical protein